MLPVGLPFTDPFLPTDGSPNSIVVQLAQSLDLNSLHALSRTCRQVRENLLQFNRQLVTRTLRCINEPGQLQTPKFSRHTTMDLFGMVCLTPRKVGACARDMVNECRRCGIPVCRVCPGIYLLPIGRGKLTNL